MSRPFETLVGTQLNSIWVEGRVHGAPSDLDEGEPGLRFRLEVADPEASLFWVEAPLRALEGRGERLAEGRPVRIIGRLTHPRPAVPGPRRTLRIIGELIEPLGPAPAE